MPQEPIDWSFRNTRANILASNLKLGAGADGPDIRMLSTLTLGEMFGFGCSTGASRLSADLPPHRRCKSILKVISI